MRAVYQGKKTIEFERDIIPELKDDELLIKVTGCGVCGTDVHIYNGEISVAEPPVVIGHEITGIVENTGKDVKDINSGTPVAVDPVIPCRTCYYCRSGKPNLCDNLAVIGYHLDGGFERYTKAPRSQVYPLSENVSAKGRILVEPAACVINGYDKLDMKPGSTVLVLGAGPIGLIWLQLLKHSPVKLIVQTDIVEMRCKKANELGADIVLNRAESDLKEFTAKNFKEGFDIVIDATGDPKAVEEGIELTAKMGTMMIFGLTPQGSTVSFEPLKVYDREMRIISSKMPPLTLERAVRLIESGKIDYEKIVSHTFPLEKLPEALDMFENGKDKVLKMLIDPWME
ncbi:zinc-dependent alcohol dehydrogenase family protein [candidate division KSB1 bacterium]